MGKGAALPGWKGVSCASDRPVSVTMKELEVAAGLIFRDGRLLITQRRDGDHLGGLWEFPGGKREAGESFETCLQRELREELGVEVEVQNLVAEITHAYPDRLVHLQFLKCRLIRHEPQPHGCQAVAWVTPDELASYTFPAADERLLAQLQTTPELWR